MTATIDTNIDSYILLACIVVAVIVYQNIAAIRKAILKQQVRQQIMRLSEGHIALTPEKFFAIRNRTFESNKKYANLFNFSGIYILHNRTKNQYYVGQATKVISRVNNHFTGRGNGDVYADYKYGDKWTIRAISLEKSGCKTLNELEKRAIFAYDAYQNGYNKTIGNN